jgi:hypothetical protein
MQTATGHGIYGCNQPQSRVVQASVRHDWEFATDRQNPQRPATLRDTFLPQFRS